MTAAPDAVEAADSVPHVAAVQAAAPDDNVQVTPWLLLSFVTAAVKASDCAAWTDALAGEIATLIGRGVGLTVAVAAADLVASATDVAVSLIVAALVALAGAV